MNQTSLDKPSPSLLRRFISALAHERSCVLFTLEDGQTVTCAVLNVHESTSESFDFTVYTDNGQQRVLSADQIKMLRLP